MNKKKFVLLILATAAIFVLSYFMKENATPTLTSKRKIPGKTFDKTSIQPSKGFKKIAKPTVLEKEAKVVELDRKYLLDQSKMAIQTIKDGRVTYELKNSDEVKEGYPVLNDPNTGAKAIFTGNLTLKTDDNKLIGEIVQAYQLKVIQKFEHLDLFYLSSKNPSKLLETVELLQKSAAGAALEFELIKNPIKTK